MLEMHTQRLVAISPATLLSNSFAGVDIYASSSDDSAPILFCSKTQPISRLRLKQLAEDKVFQLFVGSDCFEAYQAYLRSHWEQIAADRELPANTRVSILNEVIRDVLNTAFRKGCTQTIVEASQSLSDGIVKIIGDERLALKGLYDVLHHDYATFTHSANVATYAVLLAKKVGYSDEEQKAIAVAALLHDLGKLSIDERILRKAGRLDEFEFKEIKKHPLVGFRKLVDRDDLSFPQLMMVYQHHEKLDGTGYPVGVVQDEIHPWAKLCSVVDIFEALTSNRPYRSMMEHGVALQILNKAAGKELDGELVRCWSELVLKGGNKS